VAVEGREQGSCYAHAATYAWLNTVARIPGAPTPPSFAACFRVADFNRGKGGSTAEAVRRLEEQFGFGVCVDKLPPRTAPSIRDILITSVIVSFTTSWDGWARIIAGSLLDKPSGDATGVRHATLIEGYDLEKGYAICKNSWGDSGVKGRFNLRLAALHDFYCIHVYYTRHSVAGKQWREIIPRMEKFTGELDGQPINCAWLDEEAAKYSPFHVCEHVASRPGPLNYIAYDVHEWIRIKGHGRTTAA
jgi:hypothetical protein